MAFKIDFCGFGDGQNFGAVNFRNAAIMSLRLLAASPGTFASTELLIVSSHALGQANSVTTEISEL